MSAPENAEEASEDGLVTVDEFAKRFGVQTSIVRWWCKSGKIPFELVGPRKLRRLDPSKVLVPIVPKSDPAEDIARDIQSTIEILRESKGLLPNVIIASGLTILSQRPEMAGKIDPNLVYRITGDSISLYLEAIEEESDGGSRQGVVGEVRSGGTEEVSGPDENGSGRVATVPEEPGRGGSPAGSTVTPQGSGGRQAKHRRNRR